MKKEKELKDSHIKFRVTAAMKSKITEYCDNYDLTISEFVRAACEKYLNSYEVQKNENGYN